MSWLLLPFHNCDYYHDLYGVASLALVPMEPAQEIMPIRFDGHGVTVVHSDVTIKGHTPEVVRDAIVLV